MRSLFECGYAETHVDFGYENLHLYYRIVYTQQQNLKSTI